ncbi:hypothetical protein [Rhizobacter sp. SG703]|uniref:fascin domain-containing protein n=1 Tax=Rhizobacter sp. SG703 TaxID=2587140 RepID=UPI0014464DC4|nr:hypothetical protein [Rhizobacter sp. SG703]NKI93723.1 hypothetical protein [Rhizobacter sp. SG703]
MNHKVCFVNLTQEQLDSFKRRYPDNPRAQALTLSEVLDHAGGRDVDWSSVLLHRMSEPTSAEFELTDCERAIGWVVYDAIILAVGAVFLRATVNQLTIDRIARLARPARPRIEVAIRTLLHPHATLYDQARAALSILSTLYNSSCLGAVIAEFNKGLSWWDKLLYGITAAGTVVMVTSTGASAAVAEFMVLLATFSSLLSDAIKATEACNWPVLDVKSPEDSAPVPTASGNPFPFEPVIAIQTLNGNFLTVANNGGLGNSVVGLRSDATTVGPMERFTIQFVSGQDNTFALRTGAGNYITAVNGGGINGPNDNYYPIHTHATEIRQWEKLTLVQQNDGTYAICTSTGYYLSARNGFRDDKNPINTDRETLGPWETFTVVRVL